MSRTLARLIALTALIAAGCGGSGGLNFWLYPEPRLAEAEEAVFLAYETHQVQEIDGEDTALKCWGGPRTPQAYSRRDVACRLHIQPGPHTVVFHAGVSSRERSTLTFNALPGTTYSLDRSGCTTYTDGRQETCRVRIREIEDPAGR